MDSTVKPNLETVMKKWRRVYFWWWFRWVVVTGLSIYIYIELIILVDGLALVSPTLATVLQAKDESWMGATLLVVGGILVWWRITKVLVLRGAPYAFGALVSFGRQDEGVSGRPVTFVHIGTYSMRRKKFVGEFLLGIVFRAHPSSDKLVRNRLQCLIFALPRGYVFFIAESSVRILKLGQQQRARTYEAHARPFSRVLTQRDKVAPSNARTT